MHATKFNTNFFEQYARISLIDLLGDKYSGLVNLDRPDLQDTEAGIGIEVTRAIEENRSVAQALEDEIAGVRNKEISDKDLETINNYGYSYGIYKNAIGKNEYDYWRTALTLKRIIENKVHKVADGFYGNFAEFGLYIFSKNDLTPNEVHDAIAFTIDLQKNNGTKYAYMFISQIQEMFVCNLQNGNFEQLKISRSQRKKFYKKAVRKNIFIKK